MKYFQDVYGVEAVQWRMSEPNDENDVHDVRWCVDGVWTGWQESHSRLDDFAEFEPSMQGEVFTELSGPPNDDIPVTDDV